VRRGGRGGDRGQPGTGRAAASRLGSGVEGTATVQRATMVEEEGGGGQGGGLQRHERPSGQCLSLTFDE
jgi:hypothetical protein